MKNPFKRLFLIISILVFIACDKTPDRFTTTVDGKLLTLDWTSISVELIPVYFSGIKSGNLKPLDILNEESQKKIKEETSNVKVKTYYRPNIKINQATYEAAVEKFSSLFNILRETAQAALPTKDNWSRSITKTEQLGDLLDRSPQKVAEYIQFAEQLPSEAVNINISELYEFLKEQAEIVKQSETATRMLKTQAAYVVRYNNDPKNIVNLIVYEDAEWPAINNYYQSHR